MKTRTIRIVLSAAVALCGLSGFGQGIKISDYRKLISLSSVQVSPGGTKVAFVRSAVDFKEDKRTTSIVVVDIATGASKDLTDGKKSVSSPRWSPSGTGMSYLSEGSNKVDQVFLKLQGDDKPKELTHTKQGVQNFAWSPSGDRIAYVTPDDDPNQAAIDRHDDLFEIHDDGYLISHVAVPSHLWVVKVAGGPPKRLTHGSWSVLENAAPFVGGPSDPSWSRDGRLIVFARQANANNSASDLTQISTVDAATGAVRTLTNDTRYEYQPQFSSTSNDIAYLRPHGPTPLSVMDVFSTNTKDADKDLSAGLDRDVTSFSWIPGTQDLIFSGGEGVRQRLWLRRASGTTHAINLGDLCPYEFNAAKNGLIAFVGSTATTAPELYVMSGTTAKPKRVTNLNAKFGRFKYGKVTEIKWTAPDGEKCDGVLTYPVGFKAGRKYPLVVFSHGGPEGAALAQFDGFEAQFLRQPMAAEGYFFFEPNYRGSDNLGNHHEHAIYRDPGVGPAKDVMSGIAALKARGFIDSTRISVAGHSYGGYMTAWLISHYHLWRSAVVADGAVDWRDTYNLTAVGNLAWARDSLGGSPWDRESAELYRTGSPITYAGKIKTPTLILSGTADEAVPITESFALYHALRAVRTPVRFVAIPGAHHTPDDPVRYERFVTLMRDWIHEHDR